MGRTGWRMRPPRRTRHHGTHRWHKGVFVILVHAGQTAPLKNAHLGLMCWRGRATILVVTAAGVVCVIIALAFAGVSSAILAHVAKARLCSVNLCVVLYMYVLIMLSVEYMHE